MNSYALSVLIAIMAAAGTLATVPTYASTFLEEACPDCGGDDLYYKANLAQKAKVPLKIWTDRTLYDHSTEIRVVGAVSNLRGDAPVTITVQGPQGNIVTVRQVDVAGDNTFETAFITAGPLFKQNGIYTIRAQYGPQEINDKVQVELVGAPGIDAGGACNANEIAVKGGNKTYCIPYEIYGSAVVTKASVSSETKSVVLTIDARSDGSIILQIPRSVLKSESNSGDTDFIILTDDEEADFDEIDSDSTSRTVEIFFAEGTTQIEIIGTWAVPEFGTIAAIVLAVAIISIIAVTARTRLSIFPRY
ncbi:MAG: PEFG-CTERM sorting domain-containing protein [Candidatus Nitrosotenuis sp.]|uniref:PEFG-CTERM sorting domain-containing protein n=1 Tax=Candidatus Nitrosotenuis uzonensis TaxID=1407055 RepID=A0A812F6G7_9ARCH|nr:PEFG-CTERM sorting domain-containing protein [Candidatus Nitrosotenuis uzonensis]CAE6494083.1 conserved exported hypothetical protein [Candidatus Nitrosotenuis uzonensis]